MEREEIIACLNKIISTYDNAEQTIAASNKKHTVYGPNFPERMDYDTSEEPIAPTQPETPVKHTVKVNKPNYESMPEWETYLTEARIASKQPQITVKNGDEHKTKIFLMVIVFLIASSTIIGLPAIIVVCLINKKKYNEWKANLKEKYNQESAEIDEKNKQMDIDYEKRKAAGQEKQKENDKIFENEMDIYKKEMEIYEENLKQYNLECEKYEEEQKQLDLQYAHDCEIIQKEYDSKVKLETEQYEIEYAQAIKTRDAELSKIPLEFPKSYLFAIEEIRDLMENGRADTLKEAINLYEEIQHRKEMEDAANREADAKERAADAAEEAAEEAARARKNAEDKAERDASAARQACWHCAYYDSCKKSYTITDQCPSFVPKG